MVEFETLNTREINYGTNKFIEVSKKKAITEDGEDVFFMSLAKGYYAGEGKKYKQTLTLPYNPEVVKDVINGLESLIKGA